MRFFVSALALVLFIFPSITIAKNETSICKPEVLLLFANGMDNSREYAKKNLDYLLDSKLPNENKTLRSYFSKENSDIAYNYDSIYILELLEVYQQKKDESPPNLDLFWDWLFDATDAPEWFKDSIKKNDIRLLNNSTYNRNIKALVSQYESILKEGFSILTVAHSQGNLFTNSIYENLLQNIDYQDKLAMVSVATPASHVSAGGPYITLYSDGVINDLAKQLISNGGQPPLPPNKTNTYPIPGKYDHSFIYHYIKGIPSGEIIKGYIKAQRERLEKDKKTSTRKVPKSCSDWFSRAKDIPDKYVPDDCFMECLVAKIGLDSYTCGDWCDILCKCNVRKTNRQED